MTFKKAIEKVRAIANSRGEDYFSVRYEYTEAVGKPLEIKCEVYINGTSIYRGSTFDMAIAKMIDDLTPNKTLAEAPTETVMIMEDK